ncbi:MAG: ergothioneine biosynthesis protein EgtB [Pirellulaceae bacterium]
MSVAETNSKEISRDRGPATEASSNGRAVDPLIDAFNAVRRFTLRLAEPLNAEDMVVQAMPDASPTVWHLAHTTWFFETFILKAFQADYEPIHPPFAYLFNSYYYAIGEQFVRGDRGLLTRPSVTEVLDYRESIDHQLSHFLEELPPDKSSEVCQLVRLGIEHEQQHQELILTDLKYLFSRNPLAPAYQDVSATPSSRAASSCQTSSSRYVSGDETERGSFHSTSEQLAWIGFDGGRFCFDNETPRHQQFVRAFQLADQLVTCGEYLEFVESGGYQRPEYWLSMGWTTVSRNHWHAPLYWTRRDDAWMEFTLSGLRPLDLKAPVCHVSYFEADAYARFRDARLPTEAEWEIVANECSIDGTFADSMLLHPQPTLSGHANMHDPVQQMFGDCWQWTASPYVGYPGYRPPSGATGEYNGKFMCNQYVLRGGSVATSKSHIRRTYRNFFPPEARWQFTGIRLAKD